MFARIIVLILICIVIYFIIRLIAAQFNVKFNECKTCDGLGYWRGTRGEKNDCRACNGSGKRK